MPGSFKIKVLVAPLDWGLGHTTRCIPIIKKLLDRNVEVVLAGNKTQQSIFSAEFPGCVFLSLEGYNITYARKKQHFASKIISQLPKLVHAVRNEHRWLKEIVGTHKINGVISDNRFGLHHSEIPSVLITHQLNIKTGAGFWADALARYMNYYRIGKFTQCWIPDFKGTPNLAGALSHPKKMPGIPVVYIGALSRMAKKKNEDTGNDLLFIISGPEPQRSIFEDLVFEQLSAGNDGVVVVRGLPDSKELPKANNTRVYNHLSKTELADKIAGAGLVICRSGYTSVMDINAMKARAVFIPTPGQAEQEYLGRYLHENGFALKFDQANFDLEKMLKAARSFAYNGFIELQGNLLDQAVSKFIQDCETAAHNPA